MIRIQDEPIDATDLESQLMSPRIGAVVSFTGVVRSETGERKVSQLEIQDYEGQAFERLEKLHKDVMGRFKIEDVAIVHRRGILQPGESIVFIAVVAPHRRDAFRACEYAIDHLKHEVPIWKKEYTPNGEYWVEGEECDL
jgi:molybdopterin synthase catalytic subunit